MSGERKIFPWVFRTTRALVGSGVERLWIYKRRGVGLDADMRQITLPPCPPDEDEGLPGRVARTRVPIVCQNPYDNPAFRKYFKPVFPDTQTQWCFPLLAEECSLKADPPPVLCLESTTPGGIDPKLRRRVELVTLIVGLKIAALRGMRRLTHTATDEAERWQLEQQILRLSSTRPEAAIRKLFDALAEIFRPQGISLWQYDETEDNLCHPLFSSLSPKEYRDYPRPGPWGAIGRVLKDGQPFFYPDLRKAPPELRESRFMNELKVQATAYLPGGRSGSQEPIRAQGILFVNYDEEHRFDKLERDILRWAADAAVEVLQLRSQARRYRLAHHFDLREDFAYPGTSPASQPASRAVLEAFVPHLGYQFGVLYVRDRPGSVYLRYEQTHTLGKEFKGRYLENHPLLGHLQGSRDYAVFRGSDAGVVAGAPASLHEGQILALPLRRTDELLGFCLFGRLGGASTEEDSTVLLLCRQALETLLDLDHQARSKRRHISLLAQFLRIYEYAVRETSPLPLLTAFLDALLEGSTADACSIYLLERRGPLRLVVARGDARLTIVEPTGFEEVLKSGKPRFDNSPGQINQPDIRARVVLPLRYHERSFGVLCVDYHVDHVFTKEDQWLFRVLIHQLGQSLNYFEGNRILLERVSSLAASGAQIAGLGSPAFREEVPVFEESRKLAILAKEYSGADFVDLFVLVEGNRFVLQATDGGTLRKNRIGQLVWQPEQGLGMRAFHNREPILVEDVLSDGRELGHVINSAFPEARSELIVPVLDDQQVIAIIDLNSRRPGAFNEGDSHFVQAIAAQAVALRRTAELQRVRKRLAEERDLLVRINNIAQEALGQGQTAVLERILRELAEYIAASCLSIHLLSQDGYSFDPILSVSTPAAPELLRGLNVDNSILGRAVQELRADSGKDHFLIEDIVHPPPGYPSARRLGTEPRMAELVVPLGLGPKIVGVINLEHPDPTFLLAHLDLVKAVVKGIRNALALADDANRRAGRELRRRMAEEADEFLQLLTSTVFHDAPQLVKALKLHLDALERAHDTYGGGTPTRLAGVFDRRRGEIRSTLDRLDRLSAALPSYRLPDRVDIAEIVRQSFEVTALPALPYYQQVRCRVEMVVPPEPLYVFESANWVRHILENLAINAFQAMAEHGTPEPVLSVSAEAKTRSGLVSVRVNDNGPGMPPEIAAKLGHERIPHEDKQEQLGIFHPLARKHVQRYGGQLELVRNELGLGCTFELRYPSYSAPPEAGVS
jgi:GAF domain-containing protein